MIRGGSGRRAIAAVEFALVVPVVLVMIAGGADLGFLIRARSAVSSAVAQGAYYAVVTGTSVTASQVATMVEQASAISGVTATVAGPTSYCTSGTPLALSAVPNSGTCADGTKPGSYVTISATGTAFSIGASVIGFAGSRVHEAATVRLQ